MELSRCYSVSMSEYCLGANEQLGSATKWGEVQKRGVAGTEYTAESSQHSPGDFVFSFVFLFSFVLLFRRLGGDGMRHAGWSLKKSFIEALPFA